MLEKHLPKSKVEKVPLKKAKDRRQKPRETEDRRKENKPGWCDRRGGPALA